VKEGKAKIVVGTRSAIFAPVISLGLIIMFDENNFSYKQDQSPFYHARQVAFMRACEEHADFIFVNRAPSLELYHLIQKKKVNVIVASPDDVPCASQVIDMSNYKYGKSQLISIPLSHAIEKVLSNKGKVLLVMNKKGFGSFGVCAKCQHILKCPRCDVPLTFLYESKEIACRYCNHRAPYPSVCPQCKGAYLHFTGMGIEKLESEVARSFPTARVQCYAKENEAPPKDFDILIATQAVVRLDESLRFDLTCVVQIDSELNRLDFQAGESAFSLLTHLKAMTSDKLFVQTHLRDNYCLKALMENKPALFYKKELALRRELHFPPFAHMAEIVLRSTDKEAALRKGDLLFGILNEKKVKGIEILPLQVLSLARLRDQYRFVIVIKGKSRKVLVGLIRKALATVQRGSKTITTVNVSP
jgi:primosomal protein N' (replication factor Y)